MNKKIIITIITSSLFVFAILFLFLPSKKHENLVQEELEEEIQEENSFSSNIIENVEYSSKDAKGNEYIIRAKEGEIDIDNSNIIFLKNVKGIVKLSNKNEILISSDFGKYNINNFDTIFSQNVLINYLKNEIRSGYLDFSIQRNSLIISKNVVYKDLENTLKTDVLEMDLETKDTKLFMYDKNHKISINYQN